MSDALRSHYLSVMKIPRWRLREKAIVNDCFQYCLINLKGHRCGWLLAESITQAVDIEKEKQLLYAIAKVIKVELREDAYSPTESDTNQVIILMGKKALEKFERQKGLKSSRTITTYSPGELLLKPGLKAETWKLLQPLIPVLQAL